MKKLTIIIMTVLLSLVIGVVSYAAVSGAFNTNVKPSDYKIGIPYEEAAISDKPSVILFYVDWCGYCKRFMPRYRILAKLYDKKYNFVMINVEDPKYTKIAEKFGLGAFPTVYIYDYKYDNKIHLNNIVYEDLGKMRKELDRYLRVRALIK